MNAKDLENILFLDIETVPLVYSYNELDQRGKELWDHKWQFQKETSPEVQYNKAGIYAEFAKVVCIGFGYYENGQIKVSAFSGHDEQLILRQFAEMLERKFNSVNHLLCAHNGKEFDFPFLCRRFLVNGITLPALLQVQGKKPWEIRHLDTMEMWKFGDYKNYSSLNLLSYVFNLPSPKDEIDGSMVAKVYYEEKGLDKIEKYCKKDVAAMARIFRRLVSLPDLKEEEIIFA